MNSLHFNSAIRLFWFQLPLNPVDDVKINLPEQTLVLSDLHLALDHDEVSVFDMGLEGFNCVLPGCQHCLVL